MTRATHDRQIVQIRMSGGTLLIGPTQHPDIAFWQKALRQGQLHPLAGHGLRQAERTCHAGPELRLLLDRLGVSTRSMSDTEAGYAVQRAIHDKRLSAVFIPATKAQSDADTGLADKLVPAPVSLPQTVKPRLPAGVAQRGPPGIAASPVNKQPAFDVARATPPERMVDMLRRTPKYLKGQIKKSFDKMLSSRSVASLGIGLAILAAAHIAGAGETVDGLLASLAFLVAGWSGLVALKDIVFAVVKVASATRDAELDEAAEQFAGGLTVLGEAFLTYMLARMVPKGKGAVAEEEPTFITKKVAISQNQEPPIASTKIPVNNLADDIGMLRKAAKGKGNFGLGQASAQDADRLGKSWVGDGYNTASDGRTLISKDGLRQFRPPKFKPKLGKNQANFEQRYTPSGKWQSNGHLDVIP